MKRGMKILIAVLIAIFVIFMGFASYFAMPYVKSNELIVFANKNKIESFEEDAFVSFEDLKSLQIVDIKLMEDMKGSYVELKTKKKLKFLSFDKVSISCDIKAELYTFTGNIIGQYKGEKEILFEFSNFKWNVIEVK